MYSSKGTNIFCNYDYRSTEDIKVNNLTVILYVLKGFFKTQNSQMLKDHKITII